MADLNKMYKDISRDLERNIKDENELKNIKEKLLDIMTYFIESGNNYANIKEKQDKLDKSMKKIQRRLERIEEDMYIEEDDEYEGDKMHDNDYEFEIRCPYCDEDFIISNESKSSKEIECPNCHNIIELDWNESSECDGCCNKCKEQCYDEEQEQNVSSQIKEEETQYNSQEQNDSKNQENNKNQDDDM